MFQIGTQSACARQQRMFLNKVSQQFLRRPQFGSPIRSSRNIAQNINGNSSFGFQTRSKIDVKPRRSRLV